MTTRLQKLARGADGRYFSADERAEFLGYAETLPRRFEAADAVAAQEEAILKAAVGELQNRYPNFAKYHDQGWAKCYRDLQLVLRHDVQALVLNDAQALEDRALLWLRTMLAANNLTPRFCADAFDLLREQARAHLAAEQF